jgi:hypothetical protein
VGKKPVVFANRQRTKDDVRFIKALIETGGYRPLIDRNYPLHEIVAAARYCGNRAENRQLRIDRSQRRD